MIAEGVETAEQSRVLKLKGCDEIQGYLISRPVSPEEIPGLFQVTYVDGGTVGEALKRRGLAQSGS